MSFSVKSFKELNHPVCFKEDAKLVFIKYKEMMALLSTFEDDVFKVCKENKYSPQDKHSYPW